MTGQERRHGGGEKAIAATPSTAKRFSTKPDNFIDDNPGKKRCRRKRCQERMALPPVAIEVTAIRSFGKRTRGLRPLGFEARFATSRSD